jgi:hypothetical protein
LPERLSDHAWGTALRAARTMFPHDDLPDEAYAKVVRKLDTVAAGDDGVLATIDAGVAQLDDPRPFTELGPDEQVAALERFEGSDFFKLLHATAVVELYDNPLVWRAFGYEGPSVHLGGYVDRGFNDLDWLPEPEVVSMPEVESPAAATPRTTSRFTAPPAETGASTPA